jgi:hypothetical protein
MRRVRTVVHLCTLSVVALVASACQEESAGSQIETREPPNTVTTEAIMATTTLAPTTTPAPTTLAATTTLAPITTTTSRATLPPTTMPPPTSTLPPTTTPAPPPPAVTVAFVPAIPASDCDPNYEGACVPIASDVDCAGGSGNGPAYVDGPVRVIGSDIYGLDGNDNDGIGCES